MHIIVIGIYPLLFIQHDGTEDQPFGIGKSGWQLHPDLFILDDEILIYKHFPDAFQETNLNEIIKQFKINTDAYL